MLALMSLVVDKWNIWNTAAPKLTSVISSYKYYQLGVFHSILADIIQSLLRKIQDYLFTS